MFLRYRRQRRTGRLLFVRVGLFFLAAGIWLSGALIGNRTVTGAAIAVLLVALLLGLAEKPVEEEPREREPE